MNKTFDIRAEIINLYEEHEELRQKDREVTLEIKRLERIYWDGHREGAE